MLFVPKIKETMDFFTKKRIKLVCIAVFLFFMVFSFGETVHELEKGETLYSLSKRYGVSLDEIIRVNKIKDPTKLKLGQKIIIPAKGEQTSPVTGMTASGLININTANSITLQEIPGVGPATAEKIIAYRTENGRFAAKEDIKNVSGIGDKTYEKMKDRITV